MQKYWQRFLLSDSRQLFYLSYRLTNRVLCLARVPLITFAGYFYMSIMHHSQRSGLVLYLDVLKAFDIMRWSFLWETMAQMGFGPHFVQWVCLLYADPRARVRTNRDISVSFSLKRGTRQGCTLSPLLFALAIEPLALAVQQTSERGGYLLWSSGEDLSLRGRCPYILGQ